MTHSQGPAPKPGSLIHKNEGTLREIAMGFPEAWEDFPWGHSAFKVRKKVFLFLSAGEDGLSLSLKLTDSHFEAMLLPFVEATGYGLGKSGWITASFGPKDRPPMGTLATWIEESYRAVALKTLVKLLDAGDKPSALPTSARRKKAAKKTVKETAKGATNQAKKRPAKRTTKPSISRASKKARRAN